MSVDKRLKLRATIAAVELALCELDALRPLHYGRDESGDREVVPLGNESEHYVKEELATLPMLVDALRKELEAS